MFNSLTEIASKTNIIFEKYEELNILKCKSELKLNSNNKYNLYLDG